MIRSFIKPVNLCKAGYTYLKSALTGNPEISGFPAFLSVELTNYCNLNCPQCPSGAGKLTRKKGFMESSLFNRIIEEAGPYLYNLNLYFQGEPMLHPSFFILLDKCGDIPVSISTNGHFLSEENSGKLVRSKLKKVIISLDGFDAESYSAYRINGNFQQVIAGIKNIAVARKKADSSIKIELQCLVNRFNENKIEDLRKFANDLDVSLALKSMQLYNNEDMSTWLPENEKYRRYRQTDGNYIIKSDLKNRCARMWFNPVITWDGKVVPCCFDKDAEYVMGDLNSDSFRDIWDGPKYRTFRKSILYGRDTIEMCRNCTSGLRLG